MMDDFISSFKLISHTKPERKLIVHLSIVYEKAKHRLEQLNIDFCKLSISKDEFEKILQITMLCHDFGKASIFFQQKLFQDEFNKNVKLDRLSQHGLISAFFGYFIALDNFGLDKRLASFVFMAIRCHHLDLDNAEDMQMVKKVDTENVLQIFNDGMRQNSDEIDKIYNHFFNIGNIMAEFEKFLKSNFSGHRNTMFFWQESYDKNDIFIFELLFSLLVFTDKEDAIFRDSKIKNLPDLQINSKKVEEFKESYFETKEKTPLDNTREKIYQSIVGEFNTNNVKNNKVFFVELPTGAGKTLLLYKLALQMKEEQKYQKIFYLLPFITLIEQNADILKSLLEFMGIATNDNRIFLEKHSLSGEFVIDSQKDEYDIDKKQFLLDTLESEFVVTSFHQFFYGVFKRKNALLKRFHQFINSIILIDEIQLIPLDLMYPLTQFFNFMSEIFNCKIIVASATFPNIKSNLCDSYTFNTVKNILSTEENKKFFNRYQINIDISESYTIERLYTKIDEKVATNRDLLFRVNTVNTANNIYDYLISKKIDYEKENIYLLTSAIVPIKRKEIIESIKSNSQKNIRQIVVATQLIQAGVDISLEDGFEELAPFDLIIQSMGRRNRSAEKSEIGKADIIRIVNKNGRRGDEIYNKCDINYTVKILEKYKTITEQEIYERGLLNKYYDNAKIEKRSIDEYFEKLNFRDIDEEFVLIPNSFGVSFFVPIDENSKKLWFKMVELDNRKQRIKKDKDFWSNMKNIENEYSKIKKDINLYIVNQNLYYESDEQTQVMNIIDGNFPKALSIYLADKKIFDDELGLQLKQYLKDEMEGLFW